MQYYVQTLKWSLGAGVWSHEGLTDSPSVTARRYVPGTLGKTAQMP